MSADLGRRAGWGGWRDKRQNSNWIAFAGNTERLEEGKTAKDQTLSLIQWLCTANIDKDYTHTHPNSHTFAPPKLVCFNYWGFSDALPHIWPEGPPLLDPSPNQSWHTAALWRKINQQDQAITLRSGKSVTIISPTTCRDKAVRPRPSSSGSMCPRVNAMLVIGIFGFRYFVLFHLWSRRDSIHLSKIAEETDFNRQLKSLSDVASNQHLSLTHRPSLSNILTNRESIIFFPLGFCQRSVPSVHNYQAVFWHSQSLSTHEREAIKTRSRSCITRPCATQSMLTMPFSTVVILLIDTLLNAFCKLMESSASYTLKKSLHLVAKGFINLPAWCWRASITP